MKVSFTPDGWDDLSHWIENDRKKLSRISRLIKDTKRHPFTGIGDPEPLKHEWAGWWSRRIDQEHRLIYRVTGTGESQTLEIAQCRHHY
jgi:toxin YoeB